MSELGNKEIMAANIRRYMEQKGLDRKEFCQRLGFKYSTVSDWLNAEKYPRIDKIEMMANFFGVSKADLVEPPIAKEVPSNWPIDVIEDTYRIPVIGNIAAGTPIFADETILGYEYINSDLKGDGYNYFALHVQGRSMEPTIHDGDTVIVRQQSTVDSGGIAVVIVNGDDATVKEVKEVPGGIMLVGHNPAVYQPHTYTNAEISSLPVRILGKVVEIRRRVV